MTLISNASAAPSPLAHRVDIGPGSGAFLVPGGPGHEAAHIGVYYHRPARFGPNSPVLLVIPGAGRNADDYRDAWVEASEARSILVVALSYPEAEYDLAGYQMGGVIKDLQLADPPKGPDGALPDNLHLRDEQITFRANTRRETWIFPDFDRIFTIVAAAAGSTRVQYDLFGHSAGGQILHRLALLHPETRADRIVAANGGLYTLPTLEEPMFFGLKDTGVTPSSLGAALQRNLVILLGEEDNDPERGGQHLHTPLADRQGLDRLSRGKFFHRAGAAQAQALGVSYRWRLELVPGVGHDYRGMGKAAAQLLYG
jgi:pimeloyl-ACP methyl ester carboxylesterase